MSISNKLNKINNYIKKNGIRYTALAAVEKLTTKVPYEKRSISQPVEMAQREKTYSKPVKFSVVVPAYNTNPEHFLKMVESVAEQTYSDWELVIGDSSPTDALKDGLKSDERIKYVHLDVNGGISENTNETMKHATGDYICLLDHDDFIEPDALYRFRSVIDEMAEKNESVDRLVIYSDEDKCDGDGKKYFAPHYKLDFNFDHLLSNNYICHFLCMKAELIKKLELRSDYDGAQDYDLVLRAVLEEAKFVHVPMVLYHWRCHDDSTASNPLSKMYAYEAGKRALEDFGRKKNWTITVSHSKHLGYYNIEYEDFWKDRTDVLAITGPVYINGKMVGGALNSKGQILYEGIPNGFSGYMHRVEMTRDVDGVIKEYAIFNPNKEGAFRYLYDPNYGSYTKL